MIASSKVLKVDRVGNYSIEIWHDETCVGQAIVLEPNSERARRAAIVALAIFELQRPDLRDRLVITVRDAEGSEVGEDRAVHSQSVDFLPECHTGVADHRSRLVSAFGG